jgi:hypothetical protein
MILLDTGLKHVKPHQVVHVGQEAIINLDEVSSASEVRITNIELWITACYLWLTETVLFRLEVALESLDLAPGNAALFHEIAKLVDFYQNLYIRRNIADTNH